MRKFGLFVCVFVFVFLATGVAGTTDVAAQDSAVFSEDVPIQAEVVYDREYVKVISDKQVFFQTVKSKDTNEVKAANWIAAAADSTGTYVIDFSGNSNTKDVFFALTTDEMSTVPEEIVWVDAVVKSVKISIDYKIEILKKGIGFAEIISGLTIKGVDKKDDYVWDGKTNLNGLYSMNWRRGTNGEWKNAAEFDQLSWAMVRNSGTTLYVNVCARRGANGMDRFRCSKEIKIKIPTAGKAPKVKVDYAKGTIALKNGMQVRVNGCAEWMDIVAYDKNEKSFDAVFAPASANAVTKTKVSNIAVADFVAAIRNPAILGVNVNNGSEITIEVRNAATNKKVASNSTFLKMVVPEAAPTVAFTEIPLVYREADVVNDLDAMYEIDFTALFVKPDTAEYDDYEYVFVGVKTDGVNVSKQKWTKLDKTGKVDLAKNIGTEYKYYKLGETKNATGVLYEKIDAIYIRKSAVKATQEVTGTFASAYGTIDVRVSRLE